MKILATQNQSPGDIAIMTATIRDLKKSHPEIHINCKTSAQELWYNNPYLDTTINEKNADKIIPFHYPLINQSTQGQHHFIHGFRLYAEEQLGIRIPAGEFCVDIHMSEQEKNDPYITNIVGDRQFWIVDAGHKKDFTCKMWEFDRFQQVIDQTSDRIIWVQIGAKEHNHKPLENVINLLGKTTHRQLISLMYRCSGVLTPVSYPMVLSTMQWKDHPNGHRPCVVISGAREPAQWQAFGTHQFIHNCGILDCATKGACWKSRVVRLNDGSKQDNSICLHPVKTPSGQIIPKCLDMITVDEVVRRIHLYVDNM